MRTEGGTQRGVASLLHANSWLPRSPLSAAFEIFSPMPCRDDTGARESDSCSHDHVCGAASLAGENDRLLTSPRTTEMVRRPTGRVATNGRAVGAATKAVCILLVVRACRD